MRNALKSLMNIFDIILGARCANRKCRSDEMVTVRVYPGGKFFLNRCRHCGSESRSPYFLPTD